MSRERMRYKGSGFRVQGAGFRVQGSGFRVQGSGCRVQGSACRVQGSGFRTHLELWMSRERMSKSGSGLSQAIQVRNGSNAKPNLRYHLTECIYQLALERQIPQKTVKLIF